MAEFCIADDGLIAEKVGTWVRKKHKILTDYVVASGGARRKYLPAGAAYIDVFCGPGRSKIRETNDLVDGSAIAAFKAGTKALAPFTSIEISDADDDCLKAAVARLNDATAPVRPARGPAVRAIKEIVGRLNPSGLHFAFLDPHNLGSLSFSLFEELAKLRHIDVLVHVSVGDLQRNTGLYISEEHPELDSFAPGWRDRIGTNMNHQALRREIIKYWSEQVEAIGLPRAEHCELVTGSKEQRLYWLMFLARHELAHKLWTAISSEAKSPTLDL